MTDVLDLADRLWRGDASIEDHHPFSPKGGLTEVGDGTAFLPGFANVSALATEEGLLLVDTGSPVTAASVFASIREWSPDPVHTVVYSHGHIDHVFGVGRFEEEAAANDWPAPLVIAHEALPARFDRYVLTAGYNAVINQRQFQIPELTWPTHYRYPDETYSSRLDIAVGDEIIELHHARGETDDHTWTWAPQRGVLCCGDLFIWASPNAGNPQKVQRYPREWAAACREMAGVGAEMLLPGHGVPVVGADRIVQALTDTAELLEFLHDATLAMMNEGARLDDIVHSVRAPGHLLDRPYLRPIYDEPEFIVRNVWRLYGGWYDGDPSHLKPAPAAALASEMAALAGGATTLATRAEELAAAGDEDSLRLAGHLAELAALAVPTDAGIHAARARVFTARARAEESVMARGVFSWAASESTARAAALEGPDQPDVE
ncbi:MAG TPA: alkyl sulfatase dimerization domain-containing protein [Acidimicrobiales bacterium]|nr:alkyl sulfatase dimerization domain-containing protein [Acidimicrobiales bacterium]